MMKRTELVFVLDKSGSMRGLEEDTIGGYNKLLGNHKSSDEEVILSTVLFDTDMKVLHDRVKIKEADYLEREDYVPSGGTALLDAVGTTIEKIATWHDELKEEYVPSKTLFVITTDGEENSSWKYTYSQIRKLIERQKEKGWEFIFLGANISSEEEAQKLGIDRRNAVNYNNDERGVQTNFLAMDRAIQGLKEEGQLDESWRKDIDKDYKNRGNKRRK